MRIAVWGLVVAGALIFTSPVTAEKSVSTLKKELKEALASKSMNAAYQAMKALVEMNTTSSVEALVDTTLTIENYDVEKAVGAMIVKMPEGKGYDRLCQLATKHREFAVRVVLTLALAHRHDKPAYTAVLTNLHDSFDSVVFAALEGVEKLNDLATVPHLIRALEIQEKRHKQGTAIWFETRKTLKLITGKDLELAADWKNFWDANGRDYKRPEKADKEITSVELDPPIFFDIEVGTKKMLFLLDVSGSMEIKDPLPEEAKDPDKDKGKTVVNDPKKRKKKEEEEAKKEIPDSRMRLRRVQKELIAVIDKLPPDTLFNIITFNHEIKTWKNEGNLVPANNVNKTQAKKFIRDFSAQGETYTDYALRDAFDVSGIDTIFLLSDGAPRRKNKLLDPNRITQWVRESNRFRRIRIHTVGFEQAGSNLRRFMSKVARQNNGVYKELR